MERQLREKYAAENGTIIDEFYCRHEQGGAILTRPDQELRKKRPDLGIRELKTICNTGEPNLMKLLYDCERMSMDVAHVFDRNRQETEIDDLIGSIYGAVESVLDAADDLVNEPNTVAEGKNRSAAAEVRNRVAGPMFEVEAVAKRVDIAVQRQARFTYLGGVLAGAVVALGMFALIAASVQTWGNKWVDVSAFTAATSFGVLGAIASVFQRVSKGSLVIDYTAPLAQRLLLGALRPFVGGLFGLIAQFILVSGPMASQAPGSSGASTFAFFAVAGFISGFSERFAVDMIERAGQGLADTRRPKTNEPSSETLDHGGAGSAGSGG